MPKVKPLTAEEIEEARRVAEAHPNGFTGIWLATIDEREARIRELEAMLTLRDKRIVEIKKQRDDITAEITRLTAMVQHLESWRSSEGIFMDLTNPEAEVEPLITRIKDLEAERGEARKTAFRECAGIADECVMSTETARKIRAACPEAFKIPAV